MTGFLTNADITLITQDFARLIAGPDATPLTIRYLASRTGGTFNATYQQWVGATETYTTVPARGLQVHITDRDKDMLSFADVKVGDCIFQLLPSLNLANKEKLTVTDPDSRVWEPVVQPTLAFSEYIQTRIGSTQIMQPIHCRLRQ